MERCVTLTSSRNTASRSRSRRAPAYARVVAARGGTAAVAGRPAASQDSRAPTGLPRQPFPLAAQRLPLRGRARTARGPSGHRVLLDVRDARPVPRAGLAACTIPPPRAVSRHHRRLRGVPGLHGRDPRAPRAVTAASHGDRGPRPLGRFSGATGYARTWASTPAAVLCPPKPGSPRRRLVAAADQVFSWDPAVLAESAGRDADRCRCDRHGVLRQYTARFRGASARAAVRC